jgi:serine phosphatase RsbU (regulator of sigma subunit)/PAS domain-containing protein
VKQPLRLPAVGGRIHQPALALALGFGIEVVLAVVDHAMDSSSVLVAALLLGPLVVALLAGPRETAIVALFGVAVAVAGGAWNDEFGSAEYWIRLAVLVAGSVLATVGAGARRRTSLTLDRFELLAAVGEVADGSLALAETVERVLDILVPALGDLCVIDGRNADGSLRRLGARVNAPDAAEVEQALLRRRVVPAAPVGMAHVIETRQSQLLSSFGDDQLRMIASDEADFEMLRSVAMTAAAFVPLRSRGRLVGALALAVGRSGRALGDDDLRFAEVLAGRVALALDNAGLTAEVSSLERRLNVTLANLAEAVTVTGPDGRMVFANAAAVALLRVDSPADLIGADPGDLMDRFHVSRDDGSPVTLADLPGPRAMRGETPGPLLVRNVVRATGEERWLVNKATPLPDDDGAGRMVVNVIEDVTEVKRAEFAQRLLAEAGELLSSSLDYEQTLQQVARLAVPRLADWCGVTMPDEDGVLRSVAVAHVDPGKVAWARRLGERYPSDMSDEGGAAEVIRSGESQMFGPIPDEMIVEAAVDEEHLELLRGLQMRSVLIVPLSTGQETVGVLSLVAAESARVFDEDDRALAQELGRRAAIAVENARLYTERSSIAATLQRSLLPPELPAVPGWELASLYRAAGAQNDVGGDFYDVFRVPSGWMVVVGDVAGRGAGAAALTSLARYTMRAAGKLLDDPLATAGRLNSALRERPELSLVSVCCALLREDAEGAYADVVCAGHPLPFRLPRGGQPEQVGAFGPFLGAFDDSIWHPVRVPLDEGDQLVLYTDGVIDTVGALERFGEQRLAETLAHARGPEDAVARIDGALAGFERGAQRDDTAVLALRRVAPASAPAQPAIREDHAA